MANQQEGHGSSSLAANSPTGRPSPVRRSTGSDQAPRLSGRGSSPEGSRSKRPRMSGPEQNQHVSYPLPARPRTQASDPRVVLASTSDYPPTTNGKRASESEDAFTELGELFERRPELRSTYLAVLGPLSEVLKANAELEESADINALSHDASLSEVEDLKQRLANRETYICSLQSEAREQEKSMDRAGKQILSQRASIVTITDARDLYASLVKTLAADLESAEGKHMEAEERCKGVRAEVTALNKKVDELEEKKYQLVKEVYALKKIKGEV